MMNKAITITKVVSKNFIHDFFSKIQNIFGKNLTFYESMVDTGIADIQKELKEKNIKLDWYRYQISQLTNGAVVVVLYGDKK